MPRFTSDGAPNTIGDYIWETKSSVVDVDDALAVQLLKMPGRLFHLVEDYMPPEPESERSEYLYPHKTDMLFEHRQIGLADQKLVTDGGGIVAETGPEAVLVTPEFEGEDASGSDEPEAAEVGAAAEAEPSAPVKKAPAKKAAPRKV